MSDLTFLQSWFKRNCDEDWEHEYGIRVESTDNPGWSVEVDLVDTDVEGRLLSRQKLTPDAGRWAWVWSDGDCFHGACDPLSLDVVLRQFRAFVEEQGPMVSEEGGR
ncbi:Imm53 family immunity protein [Micromonospora sp. 4G55]|uniref:Imm53 family immunity protein n=1 Tax=Micromonospora sp. 4G55 TaxID=2806102 RepID=UPI001A3BEE7C|nr:immunity 53 family protein [Micromonospora sp. 4G55]